jgi:hypothetical protein
MSDTKYVVIATEEDGSQSAWGPLSGHRADQAIAAFHEIGIGHAFALVQSSADLTAEVPDWTRMVA